MDQRVRRPADRTTVRETPDEATLAALDDRQRAWLRQLLDRLPDPLELELDDRRWSTACPSWRAGWPSTTRRPTRSRPDQKAFFRLLYNLLVDAERGPRLPTLFLALGAERVRSLLTP